MKIRIQECAFFLGPTPTTHVARLEVPSPRESLIAEARALMAGKGHEIAVVGGWKDDARASLCVYTDLGQNCVDIPIPEAVARLHEAGAAHALLLHNHPRDDIGMPSSTDLRCSTTLRNAFSAVGIALDDSLIVTRGNEVISLQRLEDDAPYRDRIVTTFRAAMDARLARQERESAKRLEESLSRARIEGAIRRLERLAASVHR